MHPSEPTERRQHLLALVLAVWFAFLALLYHEGFPAGTLPAHGLVLLVAALMLCSSAGLGVVPARRLLGEGAPGSLLAVTALGLGLGILSTLVLVLLATGLGSGLTGWLLLAVGLVAGGRALARHLELALTELAGSERSVIQELEERWWALPAIALAGAGWMIALAAALAPVEFYDALIYHLAVPDRYIASGAVEPLPDIFYAHFPAAQGMLYALGMLLTTDRVEAGSLAQILHLMLGLAAVVTTFIAGRRHLSPGVGLLGALLLATIPGVLLIAVYPIADLAATFYGALMVAVLLEARRQETVEGSGPMRLAALAGLLAGLALGVKYTAAVSVGAPAFGWMLLRARRLEPARIREVIIFVVAAAAAFTPWAVRNAAVAGNPVAPYLSGIFGAPVGGPGLAEELSKRMPAGEGVAGIAAHVLTGPVRIWRERLGAGGYLGAALLLLVPFVFLGRDRPKALLPLAVIALAGLAAWSATVQVSRYLFPVLPALTLLAAYGGAALLRAAPMARTPLAVCIGWFTLHNLYLFAILVMTINPFGVALGIEMPADYLARRVDYYPAASFINSQLPESARIMMVGEGRGYYLERDYAAGSAYDSMPLGRLAVRAASTGSSLAGLLHAEGFTHLLVNRTEMARIAKMHGREGYFDGLDPAARASIAGLLGAAASRTLLDRQGVSLLEIPRE
jgi:4-amino-4-deoxy-L-arabinose transferase-like glycosyltransferase